MNKELHPSTQILERNIEQLHGKVLVVNPVEIEAVTLIASKIAKTKLSISCQDYGMHLRLLAAKLPSTFETHTMSKGIFDMAIVFLPKSDAEIELVLAWASQTLKAKGELVLIGQNNAGIKSAKKTLEKFIGPISFSDAARHSAFYISPKTVKLKKFNLDDYWQSYKVTLPTTPSTLPPLPSLAAFSLPGTFSHGRLDEGTQLLLENLGDAAHAKRILDWGCGAGSIGAALATINLDASIDMVDSSALAVASAKKTIAENKLKNCTVFESDIFSNITETYDYIVANPPFHKGHDTYYADVEAFLKEAKTHLSENGRLRIVANIFLRYDQLLEEHFGHVKTITRTNKYKILEATKVPSARTDKSRRKKDRPEKKRVTDFNFIDDEE